MVTMPRPIRDDRSRITGRSPHPEGLTDAGATARPGAYSYDEGLPDQAATESVPQSLRYRGYVRDRELCTYWLSTTRHWAASCGPI